MNQLYFHSPAQEAFLGLPLSKLGSFPAFIQDARIHLHPQTTSQDTFLKVSMPAPKVPIIHEFLRSLGRNELPLSSRASTKPRMKKRGWG